MEDMPRFLSRVVDGVAASLLKLTAAIPLEVCLHEFDVSNFILLQTGPPLERAIYS